MTDTVCPMCGSKCVANVSSSLSKDRRKKGRWACGSNEYSIGSTEPLLFNSSMVCLQNQIDACKAENADLKEQNYKWVSVADRLPGTGSYLPFLVMTEDMECWVSDYYAEEHIWESVVDGTEVNNVTHWMDIPEAHKEKK